MLQVCWLWATELHSNLTSSSNADLTVEIASRSAPLVAVVSTLGFVSAPLSVDWISTGVPTHFLARVSAWRRSWRLVGSGLAAEL
jgi:hypothetical protein